GESARASRGARLTTDPTRANSTSAAARPVVRRRRRPVHESTSDRSCGARGERRAAPRADSGVLMPLSLTRGDRDENQPRELRRPSPGPPRGATARPTIKALRAGAAAPPCPGRALPRPARGVLAPPRA